MDEELARGAKGSGYEDQMLDVIFRRVVRLVHRTARGRRLEIIEIGGGDGWLFDRLRPAVKTYVNIEPGTIEFDGPGLERLRDPAYASVSCSAEDVPLHDASADLVIAIASLDHIPDPDRAIAEARRCLRSGGHLLVTLNNRRSWWKALLSRTRLVRHREERIRRQHMVLWSLAECADHVARHLRVVSSFSVVHAPYVPVAWRVILPLANSIGGVLLPRHGGHSIVMGRAE